MTESLSQPAIALGERHVSLSQFLQRLHRQGRLLPLLREAAAQEVIRQEAGRLGLSIAPEQLQQAADHFRRRQGLTSAEQTQTWLSNQRLSVGDLEDALEADLLTEKLKDHLTRERIEDYFSANQEGYARIRLRQIVVPREDLARELLTQIHDEGRDFAELAVQHSRHPSAPIGGVLGEVYRRQLPPEVGKAVFAAGPGQIVGPIATQQGFVLLLVEEMHPAQLDRQTTAGIRQELFDRWLEEQLRGASITFPLLDVLG